MFLVFCVFFFFFFLFWILNVPLSTLCMLTLKLPDLKDAEAVQKFFLEEIQLGEELLSQGEPRVCSLLMDT